MKANRWAAHAALMTTLVAGLTACGGGGDPTPVAATKAAEEQLTAGLTLREGTGPVPANGTYLIKLDGITADFMPLTPNSNENRGGSTTVEFQDSALTPRLYGFVTFKTTTGEVEQVILGTSNVADTEVGCGTRYATPCSGLTVNTATGAFTAKSVVLKSLNIDWTALDTTVGQVIVSGIFTPPAP